MNNNIYNDIYQKITHYKRKLTFFYFTNTKLKEKKNTTRAYARYNTSYLSKILPCSIFFTSYTNLSLLVCAYENKRRLRLRMAKRSIQSVLA